MLQYIYPKMLLSQLELLLYFCGYYGYLYKLSTLLHTYIQIKGKHITVEEINNETIETENFEIISGNETENITEEISGTETINEETTSAETIANETIATETINIDYTTILQQTNTYLNFLIFMFVLFLMLNFVERK